MISKKETGSSEKREKTWLCLVVAALLITLTAMTVSASKVGRALTNEEISTVWIGVSEDELSLLRLTLNVDGTGHGGYLYRGHDPQTFKILSWSNGRRFVAEVEFAEDPGNFSELLLGELVGPRMEIKISGNGWKQQISMRMESHLLEDWTILAAATGFRFPLNPPTSNSEETSTTQ